MSILSNPYARIAVKVYDTRIVTPTMHGPRRVKCYTPMVLVPREGARPEEYTCEHMHKKPGAAQACGLKIAKRLSKETGIPVRENLLKAEQATKARKDRERQSRLQRMGQS